MLVLGGGSLFFYFAKQNQPTSPLNQAKNNKADLQAISEAAKDSSPYVEHSVDFLSRYQGKKKVLFFHAKWCPTCKAAEEDILSNIEDLPDNVVIIKTDYDTQKDLIRKYNVTYQHTFVIVDDQGNELDKWNGGEFQEIVERL